MHKVYQDKFGPNGNCLSAAIASIFDLPLRDVPWFAEHQGPGEWHKPFWEFITLTFDRQPYFHYLHSDKHQDAPPLVPYNRFHLIGGWSPRGYQHACVGFNGKIVYDPHPDGGGLIVVTDFCAFFKDGENHEDVYRALVPGLVR